ncbi:hypothetical protein VN97_g10895 [Penicillium thymicola]|uniref:NACHT domain-containing protein n=1 Tax=Penicillium thymicola TaxID=293382 RepID=A0AAI9X3P9_PENTH|nr:hypothetical protein VN97_g10895 [Penicillium thymicola]
MATTIFHGGGNSGFQAGVINGNIGNVTIVQSETLSQACLRDLRTTNPSDDKNRVKNTNGGLLEDSYRWILDNEEFRQWQDNPSNRLLWIRGDPGKGKTMLLCGIIEQLTRLPGVKANIPFFFCQATDMRINNATSVLRGLIYLLVEKNPSLLSHVRARYDHAGRTLFEDVNAWDALLTIFTDILKDRSLKSAYLIIDALDECIDGLRRLLDLIIQASAAHSQIKWIIFSRNWPEIEERIPVALHITPISLELNEISVSEAVNKFIQHKVNYLASIKKYTDRTRDTILRHLLSNAQGTFLWVALVCEHLNRTPPRHAIKKLQAFPPGLDDLYSRMMDQVRRSEDAELCKQILAIISTVYRPITLGELDSLIEISDHSHEDYETLSEIIGVCGSFLSLRGDTVMFVHQSAKDFLVRGALNEIFPQGIEAKHCMIFARSLSVIFETLTLFHDIYLPGMWIWRAVVGCSGVGQVQVFGGQKYLNSRTPIGLKI